MKKAKNILLAFNAVWIALIFVLNYFYQRAGFDFTLKCVCSGAFALLGLVNFASALALRVPGRRFYTAMAAGLVLACLGDVLIGYDFIIGAATFALGHVCFIVAYCFSERMRGTDFLLSGILFAGTASFLLFSPLLIFEVPMFRIVCLVYALIISLMLGKATGNFIRQKTVFTGVVAFASALFFFSDLMLVLDRFVGLWDWTAHACMGTYYPALCLLALSMTLKMREGERKS